MEVYLVGGAVRDYILNIKSHDKDYVVVNSCSEELIMNGFRRVGADFPIFLHPKTNSEYALARTSRNDMIESSVSIEEDLSRRDLTINSMAMTDNFQIIDPFGGCDDLTNKILKHTSDAFIEDPIRVLRIARLNARFPSFEIHPDTMDLMRTIVESGVLETIPNERIWTEFINGMTEVKPAIMINVLRECGAHNLNCFKPYLGNYGKHGSKRLTREENLMIFTSIGKLSQKEMNFYKIPSFNHDICRRHFLMKDLYNYQDAKKIVTLISRTKFDKNFEDLSFKYIFNVLKIQSTKYNYELLNNNINLLSKCNSIINEIDFKEELKDVHHDKKGFIEELKIKSIEKLFVIDQ